MGFQVAFESENVSAQSNVSSIQVDGASTENNATGQFGVYAILRMIIDNKLQIINRKLLVPTELPSQTLGPFSRFVVLIGFMPFHQFSKHQHSRATQSVVGHMPILSKSERT